MAPRDTTTPGRERQQTALLNGGHCRLCGRYSWPVATYCPRGCGKSIDSADLTAAGTVYSATVISVAHEIFGETYQVAYVDIPEGPRVFGHMSSLSPVRIGAEVTIQLVDRPHPSADLPMTTGLIFTPIGGAS